MPFTSFLSGWKKREREHNISARTTNGLNEYGLRKVGEKLGSPERKEGHKADYKG